MKDFEFAPSLILRTPRCSYKNYSTESLDHFLTDPGFRDAIALASSEFYAVLENAGFKSENLTQRQKLTLVKYLNRMHYRPTPFGAFSALALTRWETASTLTIAEKLDLHLSIDQEVLIRIAQKKMHEGLPHKKIIRNPTIYKLKDSYRFIKTHFDFGKNKLSYSLEEVYNDELIDCLLSRLNEAVKTSELVTLITDFTDSDTAEADEYLHSLIEAQFLLTEDFPRVTGQSDLLSADNLKELKEIKTAIEENLSSRNIPLPKHLFYVNAQRKAIKGGLDTQYQQELLGAIQVLQRIAPTQEPTQLTNFVTAFEKRFDQQEVPLLNALDPDTGIGYAALASPPTESDLLTGLTFTTTSNDKKSSIEWSDLHRQIMKKWASSPKEIMLDTAELVSSKKDHDLPLAPSISALFRVIDDRILLESAGGTSGINLIGRFTQADKDVSKIAKNLATHEQQTNPDVIFAEIGHISGIHVDNVNRRSLFYEYEIPISTVSSLPAEKQIALSDLYISVRNRKIVLRSKRHNREIIPRLSTAYNYHRNDHAIFRFLCDLQHQGLQSNLFIDLGQLFPGLDAYPRLTIGKVIINPAKWHLNEHELQWLTASDGKHFDKVNLIRKEKNWPKYIALTEGDQQLVFNLENEAEVQTFIQCLKGSRKAVLQEYLLPENDMITDCAGRPLINQLIAFLKNKRPVYTGLPMSEIEPELQCERNFSPGSQWAYFKLYCNQHIANQIIAGPISEFLNNQSGSAIEKWFFIRYYDPDPHLRLRLLVKKDSLGPVISELNYYLSRYLDQQLITNCQTDTYKRELERYNGMLIYEVEDVFHRSSELISSYIHYLYTTHSGLSYYHLAFTSLMDILDCFASFIDDPVGFTETAANSLYQEFASDKQLKVSLDAKYRQMRPELAQVITDADFYIKADLQDKQNDLVNAYEKLKAKAGSLSDDRQKQLVADLIHMHLNRLFSEEQRKQEMITYYFMHKYLLSAKAIRSAVMV